MEYKVGDIVVISAGFTCVKCIILGITSDEYYVMGYMYTAYTKGNPRSKSYEELVNDLDTYKITIKKEDLPKVYNWMYYREDSVLGYYDVKIFNLMLLPTKYEV